MSENVANGFLIKQIHDAIEKQTNNALRAKDLTMMQVSTLLTLNAAEGQCLSMKDLERHFTVAQSTVAGIVSRLEDKGLVEPLSDENDKRVKLVHITQLGKMCCQDAGAHMAEMEATLLRGFSPDECNTLNSFLMRISENLK